MKFAAGSYLYPAGIHLLKVNNRNARTRCEICSKLTIRTPERYHCRSGVFIVNFEQISHLVLVFLLLTLNMQLLPIYTVRYDAYSNFHHKCRAFLNIAQKILERLEFRFFFQRFALNSKQLGKGIFNREMTSKLEA